METYDFTTKKYLQSLTGEDYALTFWLWSESESLKDYEEINEPTKCNTGAGQQHNSLQLYLLQ